MRAPTRNQPAASSPALSSSPNPTMTPLRRACLAIRTLTPLSLSLALAWPVQAQQPPDAGQTLQNNQAPLPPPGTSPTLALPAPTVAATPPGGTQVRLQSVRFSGNTVFSEAALQAVLGEVAGRQVDMAGLSAMVNAVSQHYRQNGYPFARALLPTQPLSEGALHIEVVEGRYGQVLASADNAALAAQAQAFLAGLRPGQVIDGAGLERATLILSDQPGITTDPVIQPGQAPGTGDLTVRVDRTPAFTGELGLDNHGNRYTGQTRVRLALEANSPWRLGDQATVRGVVTEQGVWFGQLGYSLPLGSTGLRGQIAYAHSDYELGQAFASLQSKGTADVSSLGLSYPWLRSQRANVTLGATFQHKRLSDRQEAVGARSDKSSRSLPVSASFDLRDALGGGGITYGAVSFTTGRLQLDNALRASDAVSARTAGHFDKLNLDLARIQQLSGRLSLFARVSAQWADENLDSSEGFGLGGPGDVRAYPVGEGYGDKGWLGQVELRYAAGAWAPYVFHDAGHVTIDARPWTAGDNTRRIAGSGIGLRWQQAGWRVDTSVAWRTHGGDAQSDTAQRTPRVWLTASRRF